MRNAALQILCCFGILLRLDKVTLVAHTKEFHQSIRGVILAVGNGDNAIEVEGLEGVVEPAGNRLSG
jgi:hypothetical protein